MRVVLLNRNYLTGRVMSSNVVDTAESGLILCRVSGADQMFDTRHALRDPTLRWIESIPCRLNQG